MNEYWLTQYRRKYESYMREAIREGRKFSLTHDMNDPIRKLWAQCVVKHTKTPMNWQDVADEFAELIVRECLEVVRQSDDECYDEWDYADRDLCGIIKEHFGVEEREE